MTKPKMITLLSTVVLATASTSVTFADEIVSENTNLTETTQVTTVLATEETEPTSLVDSPSTSTEVVSPAEPSAPVEIPTEPTQPVETPTEPTTPTKPVEPSDPTPPVKPTEPIVTDPSTPPTTEEPKSEEPKQPSEEPVTPPSDGNGQTTPPTAEPPVLGEKPKTVKPMPEPVATFNPFETSGGQKVVGTLRSQVIVQNADGTTQTVKAEDLGGTTNTDGTVTLMTASGKLTTLPETGEEAGGLLSILGTVILTGLGFLKKKRIV